MKQNIKFMLITERQNCIEKFHQRRKAEACIILSAQWGLFHLNLNDFSKIM